jgi:hypothetical protein
LADKYGIKMKTPIDKSAVAKSARLGVGFSHSHVISACRAESAGWEPVLYSPFAIDLKPRTFQLLASVSLNRHSSCAAVLMSG